MAFGKKVIPSYIKNEIPDKLFQRDRRTNPYGQHEAAVTCGYSKEAIKNFSDLFM